MADDRTKADRADERARGDRNELEGTAKEIEGRVRGDVGDIVDNRSEHLKGRAKELEGKIQKNVGKAENEDADKRY